MPLTSTTSRRQFLAMSTLGGISLAALASMPAAAMARVLQPAGEAPPPVLGLMGWRVLQPGILALADLSTGGNTMLVVADGKALLVDTKYPYLAGAMLKDAADQIKADMTQDRIDLTLINTHHHGDHTGGNAVIVPIASASYAHSNALPRIKDQLDRYVQGAKAGPSELARNNAPEALMPFAKAAAEASATWTEKTAVPKIAINGSGNTLSVGEIMIKTHHFGAGHTDNDLVIHLPDQNIVHTGDLVFNGLNPFFDSSANATPRGWIGSLRETRKLCNETTTVIPGHGPIAGPEIIDAQIRYFEQLIESVQAEIDKGSAREEIVNMSWAFMDGLGFEQIKPRVIGGAYDELTGG